MLRNADPQAFSAVYVVCGYTDMRLGIDSLATIIQSRYQLPIFAPEVLFLFFGRRANKIKRLLWEGDGFLLLYKRLVDGRFQWPRSAEDMKQMSQEQFYRLMSGFSIDSSIKESQPKYIV